MKSIVVTGMGAVSPLSCGVELSWQRLLAGQSGIKRLSAEISNHLSTKIAGFVPSKEQDSISGFSPEASIQPKDLKKWICLFSLRLSLLKKQLTRQKMVSE